MGLLKLSRSMVLMLGVGPRDAQNGQKKSRRVARADELELDPVREKGSR
jgi:hypothetical protein